MMNMRRSLFVSAFAALALLVIGTVTPAVAKVFFVDNGSGPRHFKTIQAAVNSPRVKGGDRIIVGRGHHVGATITKKLTIEGKVRIDPVSGRTRLLTTIIAKPTSPQVKLRRAGFVFPGGGKGNGSTIKNFKFNCNLSPDQPPNPRLRRLNFPIYSSGADRIKILNNVMYNHPMQAITNWNGSNWVIRNNTIRGLTGTRRAGAIGILIGSDRLLGGVGTVENTVVSNKIRGKVSFLSDNPRGYVAAGIGLYAMGSDSQMGLVKNNTVSLNKVPGESAQDLYSSDPDVPVYSIMFNEVFGTNQPSCRVTENSVTDNRLLSGDHPLGERPAGVIDGPGPPCVGNTVTGNLALGAPAPLADFSADGEARELQLSPF